MAAGSPSRRLGDLSVIAPILGFILLIPPVIGLFARDVTLLGAPIILVYLFAVWLGLIAIAAMLARKLARSDRHDTR